MSGVLLWPDAREAVHELIDGFVFGDDTVEAWYLLPFEFEKYNLPCATTYVQRSAEGFIDRVTWVVVDVYAPPGEAMPIADGLVALLAGRPHEVPNVGYVDDIAVEQPPQDMPRPDSELVMQAQFILRVTARPVN